eukprot:153674_1
MTQKTINIMLENLFQQISQEENDVKHDSNTQLLIRDKSASEIGYLMYNYPLSQLNTVINEESINGERVIHYYTKQRQWFTIVSEATGWEKSDIYQLTAMLFQHNSLKLSQSINNIFKRDESLVKIIQRDLLTPFDIERTQFRIKMGKDITDFSDAVVNMIDEYKSDSNDHFVQSVYGNIANYFAYKYDDLSSNKLGLDQQQDWRCSNCSNYNFRQRIGSKMQFNLSICALCGIEQADSIVLQLKGHDTYVMVSRVSDKQSIALEQDDLDELIQTVLSTRSFNLQCLSRNDKQNCPSIIRLAKYLITYKRWIHTIYDKTNGNDSLQKTIHVDIAHYVDDSLFKKVFFESAQSMKKITKDHINEITTVFNQDIMNVKTFLNLKRKMFIQFMKTHTTIKPAWAGKLYNMVRKALKSRAQTQEFGKFLSDVDMKTIDLDYHHILNTHINIGNKLTIENVFEFFRIAVHYEDTGSEIADCRSVNRRDDRTNPLESSQLDDDNDGQDKNIWQLKQYYAQSQLDIIHSYLVHSNWKHFVQRYANQSNDNEQVDEIENVSEKDDNLLQKQKHKYVTNASDSNTHYGFGVDHSHPHLHPKYLCIKYELLSNILCPLNINQFANLLTKAIRIHQVTVSDNYNNELKCKYYKADYNILRNEPIGIRHLLAIIIYTDMSQFCTGFRSTYRKIDNETKDSEVISRHQELYQYARCLYEAVEFFGQEMDEKLKVFHGLNKVMNFENFTAYFNQPISTSTSKLTAQQFSEGVGIILTLKSGAKYHNIKKASTIPKYLSVSWLSTFPGEDEKLFYGENIVFEICNIIEAQTNTEHTHELKMFNMFQKTLDNQTVDWNKKDLNTMNMIKALTNLIIQQQSNNLKQNNNAETEQKHQSSILNKYNTTYGKSLFGYFCNNIKTRKVCVKNYKCLPALMQTALFLRGNQISLVPLLTLLPNLTHITLNELDIGEMTSERKHYMNAVMEYIQTSSLANHRNLTKIKFQSKPQQDNRKQNSTLRKYAQFKANHLRKYGWDMQYYLGESLAHNITFELIHRKQATNRIMSIDKMKMQNSANVNVKKISTSRRASLPVIAIYQTEKERIETQRSDIGSNVKIESTIDDKSSYIVQKLKNENTELQKQLSNCKQKMNEILLEQTMKRHEDETEKIEIQKLKGLNEKLETKLKETQKQQSNLKEKLEIFENKCKELENNNKNFKNKYENEMFNK